MGRSHGCHVAPLSTLISVKTSKKLLTAKREPSSEVVWRGPREALVGLSRIIAPGGRVPPEMERATHCTSSSVTLTATVRVESVIGAETRVNVAPPSCDQSSETVPTCVASTLAPTAGGEPPPLTISKLLTIHALAFWPVTV